MSSSYINNFKIGINTKLIPMENTNDSYEIKRLKALTVIEDLCEGRGLRHYINYNVSEKKPQLRTLIDWKRRYKSSGMMNFILERHCEFVKPVGAKKLDPLELDLSGRITKKEEEMIKMFYKENNLTDFIKSIKRQVKENGDCFVYWYIVEREGIKIPKMKIIDSKSTRIITDKNDEIIAYVNVQDKHYNKNIAKAGERPIYSNKEMTIERIFTKDGQYLRENGVDKKASRHLAELKGHFPILHFQFRKNENNPYSKIPCEDIIDNVINLDRIKSQIAYTNELSGSPQMVIVDGNTDMENSEFGANAILYVDSTAKDALGAISKQAQVLQLEIKNGLGTIMDEKKAEIEELYSSMNMVSPENYAQLVKTENSKVWEAVRKNFELEISQFYDKYIEKMGEMIEIIFKVNKVKQSTINKKITFKKPKYIVDPTLYDQLLIKAQKMNIGELSPQQNLRDSGYTEKEIEEIKEDFNDSFLEKNKDISFAKKATTEKATEGSSASTIGKVKEVEGAKEIKDNMTSNANKQGKKAKDGVFNEENKESKATNGIDNQTKKLKK